MPEGPEIHRVAGRLNEALGGRTPDTIQFHYPPIARKARTVRGKSISRVRSHGKALLIDFSNGLTLYSHNQLYGLWYIGQPENDPFTHRQLRVEIRSLGVTARLYSASSIELWKTDRLHQHPFLSKLGPDVLDPNLSETFLIDHMKQPRFRAKRLHTLLLDQHFIAGIGNYLRSEILFDARLHPERKLVDLTNRERVKLARSTLKLSIRSSRHGGITRTVQDAKRDMKGGIAFESARFWVFDRQGELCRSCESVIDHMTAAGRRLYACPACQPPSGN